MNQTLIDIRNEEIKELCVLGASRNELRKRFGVTDEELAVILGREYTTQTILKRVICFACQKQANVIRPDKTERQKWADYCDRCYGFVYALQGRERVREVRRLRDNHTCQSCGKKWEKGMRRFDIHHIYGECGKRSKRYDRPSEIDGLLTLCHKCHFNRHDFSRKNMSTPKHGTWYMYARKGCRCPLCKTAARETHSKYRARIKATNEKIPRH